MDRRRHRRGRAQIQPNRTVSHDYSSPQVQKPWSFLNGFSNLLIMTSLIAVIYVMLQHHCNSCKTNNYQDVINITRSIEDISKNLSVMRNSYSELEMKIAKFSQELPKLEGQIDILEALANVKKRSNLGAFGDWEPKPRIRLQLPTDINCMPSTKIPDLIKHKRYNKTREN